MYSMTAPSLPFDILLFQLYATCCVFVLIRQDGCSVFCYTSERDDRDTQAANRVRSESDEKNKPKEYKINNKRNRQVKATEPQKSPSTKGVTQYPVTEPSELLPFLLQILSKQSRNSVKSILTRGQVTVDGKDHHQAQPSLGTRADCRHFGEQGSPQKNVPVRPQDPV
jgi:hypothetical protein